MNTDLVKKIADAVLYEGYMLYPYRASAVKNRQRFNFGVLTPESYSKAQKGTENWRMQTEVLVLGDNTSEIDIKVRFLHLREREIYQIDEISGEFRAATSMKIGDEIYQTWQEAIEREAEVSAINLKDLNKRVNLTAFSFPADEATETLREADEKVVGKIVRRQEMIEGNIDFQVEEQTLKTETPTRKLFKITVRVSNTTPFGKATEKSRDEALAHSLVSAHTVLFVRNGEFISLLEPPDEFSETVETCKNIATYPILVGENGERDCVLSSPIILYDYPEIAPESAGDLFDGAEIDEILTLRIMTMTDAEKSEMRGVDERARKMLERTENLSAEQLMKMHGVLRQPRALGNEDFFKDDLEDKKGTVNS
ncbi:MAG: hypothetical protein ABJA66_04825 [Actinomycetota bacterium]